MKNDEIANKIFCHLGKVTNSTPNLKWSFSPAYLGRSNKVRAYLCPYHIEFESTYFPRTVPARVDAKTTDPPPTITALAPTPAQLLLHGRFVSGYTSCFFSQSK